MPTTATKSTKSTTGTRKTRTRRTTAKKTPVSKAVKLSTTTPKTVEKPVENKVTTKRPQSPRKVTTTVAPKVTTTVAPKVTTTTYESGKVVNTQTELIKPTVVLIQWKDYVRDINNRWQIHNYECQQLLKDFKSIVNYLQPYHAQAVKTVKAWTV